jgi:hypothetical protein
MAPTLSQLTMSAVSSVDTKTHRMIRFDTLFSGARVRTSSGASMMGVFGRTGEVVPQVMGVHRVST